VAPCKAMRVVKCGFKIGAHPPRDLLLDDVNRIMTYTITATPEANTSTIRCAEGEISIQQLGGGRRRIELRPADSNLYIPRRKVETSYPDEMLLDCLEISGFCWLCDEIARDEDSASVNKALSLAVFGFVPKERFAGRRLLDLGCGSGSSSVVLARALPDTEIVGVELNARLLKLAQARVAHYGLRNVRFEASPCGTRLPEDIGTFDFIVFSAVYEHLLPRERVELMPHVWAGLRLGGVLFVNQTPHRYFPIDTHSSGLPLVNYLPNRLAHWAVMRFSRRGTINRSPVWEEHLRGGLRGATEREIVRTLTQGSDGRAVLLNPCIAGLKDRVDLWFRGLSPRHASAKQVLRLVLKTVYKLTGSVVTPNLAVAIQKS
jgi:2-polyprenyl-3-methyl-5-hydroxy-6-metoxy-1,4-benzoquinol methylase